MKHTPGPWTLNGDTVGNVSICDDICYINEDALDDDRFSCGARGHANGLLISAAPDLLEALIAVVDMGYDDSPDVWKQVDAAIAKATADSQKLPQH